MRDASDLPRGQGRCGARAWHPHGAVSRHGGLGGGRSSVRARGSPAGVADRDDTGTCGSPPLPSGRRNRGQGQGAMHAINGATATSRVTAAPAGNHATCVVARRISAMDDHAPPRCMPVLSRPDLIDRSPAPVGKRSGSTVATLA
ncbi:hypothetical protein SEVIR_4G096425v4 [Setaria viridis]